MSEFSPMLSQLEQIITTNTVKYLGDKPAKEKTVENVERVAQKQLDYFIDGMIRQDEKLWQKWKGGHPFKAKAAINKVTMEFKIQIEESKQENKW
ncbi:MAG: hypothetical protein ACREL1_03200 [bacterium]